MPARRGPRRRSAPSIAVRGFHGVTLTLEVGAATADLLTEVMGYEHLASAGRTHRYAAPHSATARYLDIIEAPDAAPASSGLGSVHHIAFAVADDDAQDHFRRRLISAGHRVTPRIDRTYFHSIYFGTPGGVLFEIATAGPGVHPRRAARDPRARAEAATPARASSRRGSEGACRLCWSDSGATHLQLAVAAPGRWGGARGRSRTCKPMAGLPALIRQLRAREMNGTLPCLVARQPSVRCSTYRHTAGCQ